MSLMLDDELALINDSRYKTYTVAIQENLKQFQNSNGWPDLINNLVRVKRVRFAASNKTTTKFLD